MKNIPPWVFVVGTVVVVAVVAALSGIDPAYQFAVDVLAVAIGGIVLAIMSATRKSAQAIAELARFSPDGRWRWNDSEWRSTISPDGRSRWNGQTWTPREYSSKVRNAVDGKTYAITTFRNNRLGGWELQVMGFGGRRFWRWISDAKGVRPDFDLEATHRKLVESVVSESVATWGMDRSRIAMVQSLVTELHPADSEDLIRRS
jgi:hypothetical protein